MIAQIEPIEQASINSLSKVKSYEDFTEQTPEVTIGPQLSMKQRLQVQEFMKTNKEVFAVDPQAPQLSKGSPV